MLHQPTNLAARVELLTEFLKRYIQILNPPKSREQAVEDRRFLQHNVKAVERLVIDAGCNRGFILFGRHTDPWLEYLKHDADVNNAVVDMLEQAIGVYDHLGKSTGIITAGPRELEIITAVERGLRPAFERPPTSEKDVQLAITSIFSALGVKFTREQEVVASGNRSFKPDFVIDEEIAVEIKLLKNGAKLGDFEGQMSEDISAYNQRWTTWFVLYDCGCIREPDRLKETYQQTFGVLVTIVKH